MSAGEEISGEARPRLPRGVRLKFDEARGGTVLLAPERVVRADAVAVAILERCDGTRTLNKLVEELCEVYKGDAKRIEADVRALLADLAAKRMLDL
nr:pyrroloquinoline quinone biosynthesis peptide chaperone PqqD [Methylocapsa sp. S129]